MAGNMERVVVTGIGVVSPLGCDVEKFWGNLLAGHSGVKSLVGSNFSGMETGIGALVWDFDESDYLDKKEVRRMSRSSHFGIAAAGQAIADAKFDNGKVDPREIGVIIGSSIGGYSAADPLFKGFYLHGRISPFTIPISMNIGPGSNVSIKYGFQGPLINVDAACATAAQSIGQAFNMIRSGVLDIAVTGAADTPFAPGRLGFSASHFKPGRLPCGSLPTVQR
jgi:3-oxoacyl-(acyl-carrier-protein) synthase